MVRVDWGTVVGVEGGDKVGWCEGLGRVGRGIGQGCGVD